MDHKDARKSCKVDRVPLKVQKDFGSFLSPFHFPRIVQQREIQEEFLTTNAKRSTDLKTFKGKVK